MLTAAEELNLIRDAARDAAAIALRYFRKDPQVWWKEGVSPVSEADFEVDRFLRERLTAARPDYGWLSEETADNAERLSARRTFVVDPIDGTRAFINGLETWCISIAVVEDGRPVAGVLNCPVSLEEFVAMRGGGAQRNNDALTVNALGKPVRLAGPKASRGQIEAVLGADVELHAYVPSLAYRIAMVADGRLDGTLIKPNSHDWDLAAADLILEEAGGRIVLMSGDSPNYAGMNSQKGTLVAGINPLLDPLVRLAGEIYS